LRLVPTHIPTDGCAGDPQLTTDRSCTHHDCVQLHDGSMSLLLTRGERKRRRQGHDRNRHICGEGRKGLSEQGAPLEACCQVFERIA